MATAAAGAAAARIPLTGRHLDEAPYMGALFILLIIVSITLAIAAIIYDAPTVYLGLASSTALADAVPYAVIVERRLEGA